MPFDFTQIPNTDLWQTAKNFGEAVIYGSGNGADKIIDRLTSDGVKITAVCCNSDFVRERSFRGYRVISVKEAAEKYGDELFILSFGTSRPEVSEQIKAVSKKVNLRAATVPVYGDEIFDRKYMHEHAGEISQAFDLLADDASKAVYRNAISFYISGELSLIFDSDSGKEEVFKNILRLGEHENYIDIGAYRGDTVEEFISYADSYDSITAVEPDIKNFAKLTQNLAKLNNAKALNIGIWSEKTTMHVSAGKGRGSGMSDKGIPTEFLPIDALRGADKATYIKIDAEGAEAQVLIGAVNTLKNAAPKLNIAAYHRTGDIFALPLLLKSINPAYKLYLRKHPHIPFWDLNIYASI